ncbi:MAG: phytoene desaturase family protein, partial [Hyphomicrobiaceae bacterium]
MCAQALTQFDYDVIVVGGGHNGLACAFYLSQAGHRVVVLEKNSIVGGAAVTEEFLPGFRNSVASYTVGLLNEQIIADMALKEGGLEIVERPIANFWPMQDGPGLILPYCSQQRRDAIAHFSQRDADNLEAYDAALQLASEFMRSLMLRTPP